MIIGELYHLSKVDMYDAYSYIPTYMLRCMLYISSGYRDDLH